MSTPTPPPPNQPPAQPPPAPQVFRVELPIGSVPMHMASAEEVDLWNRAMKRYVDDYHLSNVNDLNLLGAILQQLITQFRAQRALNGMEPLLDNAGVPTGQYRQRKLDGDETLSYQKMLNTATGEIRALEKTLGIDKVAREAGGQVSVQSYLRVLKRAAHERGIHILARVKWVETFINELSTMMRMMDNLDAEDRAYHDLTPDNLLDWIRKKIAEFHEMDKKWHKEKGKLYAGKL